MKKLLWLPPLFAVFSRAGETGDGAKIAGVIAALNRSPQPAGLFTEDADASALERLSRGKTRTVREGLTVTISHEPWGEASIGPGRSAETVSPRISSGAIRFLTSDVALADGSFRYTGDAGAAQTAPLLFVLKSGAIRFLTPDVALADGSFRYTGDAGAAQTAPLLFVLKSGAIRFLTPDVALADGSFRYTGDAGAAQTAPQLFVLKSGAIRFLTPDVALADGSFRYTGDAGAAQTAPLLFVLRKEGEAWKIAAVRALSL